jgi:hypothetical protein
MHLIEQPPTEIVLLEQWQSGTLSSHPESARGPDRFRAYHRSGVATTWVN